MTCISGLKTLVTVAILYHSTNWFLREVDDFKIILGKSFKGKGNFPFLYRILFFKKKKNQRKNNRKWTDIFFVQGRTKIFLEPSQ